MKAYLSRNRMQFVASLAFIGVALWLARHIVALIEMGSLPEYIYTQWVYVFSFIVLMITMWFAYREKPSGSIEHDDHFVTVVVPAYNEDPEVLHDCLRSLIEQSRRPNEVYVVDDGSNQANYADTQAWFYDFARVHDVAVTWRRQANAGKRHAQANGFFEAHNATIFITVDSDSVLDAHALEELLKPFADENIQSVAGVVLARNNRTNVLARITDLLFVTGQLIDRSMMSSFGSVLVNSGGLAAYRAEVVRDNLHAYLHETFFGRHIEFSDDSMLTLYALARGKTVQQPSAFVFTMMPDKLSHHLRQQLRWMKGSFIRSWWRLKYLPINSIGFARQAIGWSQFVMTSTLLFLLMIVTPIFNHRIIPFVILVPIILGYAQALRYLSVKRSDESFASQLLTYMLTPIGIIWVYFVLRPIRIYAAFTCFKAGWGTRQAVEVRLAEAPSLGLVQRYMAFSNFRLRVEGRYERAARIIKNTALTHEEAVTEWQAYYAQLSNAQKHVLWADFDRWMQWKIAGLQQPSRPRTIVMRRPQLLPKLAA